MKKISCLFLLLVLLTACQPATLIPSATTPATDTSSAPKASPGVAPSATAQVTATPTIDPAIISASNIKLLKEVLTLGKGILAGAPIYTPDGKLLVVPTSSGIYLYKTADYQVEPRLVVDGYGPTAVSPDGSLLLVGERLAAISEGKSAPALQLGSDFSDGYAVETAFSPDGSLAAISDGDGHLGLWQVSDGAMLRSFEGRTIRFSPDGRFLLTSLYPESDNQTAHTFVYNIQSGERLQDWYGESGDLLPDGRALVQKGRKITIYELETGRPLRTFDGLFGALSPDGLSLLTLTDNVLRHYQIADGKSLGILEGQFNGINTINARFSPDGQYIAAIMFEAVCCGGSANASFSLWQTTDHKLVQNIQVDYGMPVSLFSFARDGRSLAFNRLDKDDLQIWQTANGESIATLGGFTAPVMEVAFTPDGKQLATSVYGNYQNPLNFYEVKTGKLLRSQPTSINGFNYGMTIHPNGKIIALSNQFWHIENGELAVLSLTQKMIEQFSFAALGVDFSPDGGLFAGGYLDGRFQVWDFEKQTQVMDATACGEYETINSLAFSPDGKRLALACSDIIGSPSINPGLPVYQVAENVTLALNLESPSGSGFTLVDWSPDGRYIVAAGYNLQIWNAVTGEPLSTITKDMDTITSLSISPDSTLVAIGLQNGTIELHSLPNGKQIGRLYNGSSVNDLAFSPDGKLLAAACDGGEVRVWGVALEP